MNKKNKNNVKVRHSDEELREILASSRITTTTEVAEENYVMKVDDVGIFAKEDIHAIKAKQKAGKTSALKVILTALMGGQCFRLTSLVENSKVVYIDTEQSVSDTKLIIDDVKRLSSVQDKYLDSHLFLYSLRKYSPVELRELLCVALEENKPDVVIIDGLVEMVYSFNDEEEAKQVIQSLLILAEKYHTAIIAVLHTNKTTDDHNMRGHLGTMLAQKAATVLECTNDKGLITVRSTEVRHHDMPTWSFHYDSEGHIQSGDALQAQLMAQKEADKLQRKQQEEEKKMQWRMDACRGILSNEQGGMLRKDLVKSMIEKQGEGRSTVQDFIKKQLEAGQLCEVGRYIQLPSTAQAA